MLKKLKKAGLLFKPKKYKFYKEKVKFLGFIVGKNKVKIDLVKVKAVLFWPKLYTVKKTQSFLGFANFY